MARFLVGLTGGLASGKSTVGRWLEEAGFLVVDADHLVAQLYEKGGEGARRVAELFGPEMLGEDGSVDRRKLAARVFADAEARRLLEAAIHPLVGERFERLAARSRGIAVLEATLLAEAGLADRFDLVVTVEADPATRRERAVRRGLSEQEVEARLAAQGDGAIRRAAARRTLRNDDTLPRLREQVDDLIADIRELAELRENSPEQAG